MKKQMKFFTNMTKPFVLFVLLFALGVGEMWGNYVYFYPASDGDNNWYADDAAFTVSFSDPSVDICDYVEVNGGGTGVWRFNISERTGTAYFKRRKNDACNGNWNQVSGTVDASHNVMYASTKSSGTMQSYVINYIHNTNQIYFDNTNSNFSGNIYFVIGHDVKPNGTADTYSIAYPMDRVAGTNLYHVEISATWEDANYYGVIASSSDESTVNGDHKWGSSNLSSEDNSGYTAAYKYVFNIEGGTYMCATSTSGNNQALTFSYCGTNHEALPKVNATQAAKKRDTGTTFSDISGSWLATLKLRGSYMKNATDTARSTITSTTSEDGDGSKTYGVIKTGTVTQSCTSLNASYHFEGWGVNSETTPSNTDATYEYNITAATTVYAFFSKLYTLTYATKGEDTGSSLSVYSIDGYSGSTTSGSSIPTGHMITLVATPATGYEVEGWYSDASCETAYTSGSGDVTIEDNNTFKLATINANTEVYCKFQPKTYTINLVGMEATTSGTTSVDVTYNASTNMTASDPITKPTKNGYTFLGYWVRNEDTKALVTKLIDENGNWIADVEGYTSHDGDDPTWVHDYAISLYAKWEEKTHTVSVAVSSGGYSGTPGKVQINSVNVNEVTAGEVTWSAIMTPIANPGWKFAGWEKTSSVDFDLEHYHSDYQESGNNSMVIKAYAEDQTITAVFEPRYYLVGGELVGDNDDITTSGMPGWGNYDAPFIVTTSSPLLATCTRTLTNADKTYKILVRDKNDGISYGVNTDPFEVIEDGESLLFDDANYKVYLYAKGGTTFTFKITDLDASGHPYVSLDRPHQMHMGHKRVDIDSGDHNDNTGGTLTASTGGNALANNDWFNYGSDIAYTATAQTGYTLTWYTNSEYSSAFDPQPGASWTNYNVTGDENIYAQFSEKVTTVNLAANGYGHIEINDTPSSNTTCGITTTRSLTAVPNDGYRFTGWTKTSYTDYDVSSTSSNPTTLSGLGSGASSGQTLTANFAERYSIKGTMNSEDWGTDHFISNIETVGGKVIGYVEMSLPANTSYEFAIYDLANSVWLKNNNDKVFYMTNGNSYVWGFDTDKTQNCGITTAGAGTYRFMWNITDKTMSVIYPNFVIYRTGDKDEDSESASHTTTSAVESYAGGTINQGIEFRMKVPALDTWYTLCLPFTVSAVKVWDEADGAYYDIYPYYRSGGNYIVWHYIIRTPKTATDLSIAEFDDWDDPTEKAFLPSANTPYIIQWHDSYFTGKYISFFGATGQTIPTSMTAGSAPSSDNVVNVHGNDAMKSGTIRDAYLLENDYGTYGAWLREDIGTDRTILPFECYIRAKAETAARYRVLRRDMTIDDTPTGLDQIINRKSSNRKFIKDGQLFIIRDDKMYNVYGMEVQQ